MSVIKEYIDWTNTENLNALCSSRLSSIIRKIKTIWILLSLVFGVLFFFLGCAMDSTMIEGYGAIVLVPGLIGLLEKLWPEKVKG